MTRRNWFKRWGCLVGLGWVGILVAACQAPVTPTLPALRTTPTCYLQPQPTGEKIVRPTLEILPPTRAQAGQTVRLRFSGSYVAVNYAEMCGGEVVSFIHDDDLPTPRFVRQLTLRLNDADLTPRADCQRECQVEFVIPSETAPGHYQLALITPWQTTTTFEMEIVGAGTAVP